MKENSRTFLFTFAVFSLLLLGAGAGYAQDGNGDGVPTDTELHANAGEDQTVAAGDDCEGNVVLDGSNSTVPKPMDEPAPGDGNGGGTEEPVEPEAIFTWTGDFIEGDGVAEGVKVEVTLPEGEHEILLTIETPDGESSTDTVLITVVDETPPVIKAGMANPRMLWPPNHKMVPVEVLVAVEDNCDDDVECEIMLIESNEPTNGRGDGNTSPDTRKKNGMECMLRAERAGGGNGRVYSIGIVCTDDAGNSTTDTIKVRVPHNMPGSTSGSGSNGSNGSNGDGDPDPDDDDTEERDDRTKFRFKVNFENQDKNRLLAKLDVAESMGDIPSPTDDSISRKDLAGWELVVELGIEEFDDDFDEDGKIRTDELRSTLTRSGFLIVDLRDIDLPTILDLDPDDDVQNAEIFVAITAYIIPPDGGDSDAIILFDDILDCRYKQKADKKAKGKLDR